VKTGLTSAYVWSPRFSPKFLGHRHCGRHLRCGSRPLSAMNKIIESDACYFEFVVRPSRAMYVENDPALRGIVSSMLDKHPDIELVASVGTAAEALALPQLPALDVALLDIGLGPDSINGVELGLALRDKYWDMGIVLFSQHVVPDFLETLPEDFRWGWSFLEKKADIDIAFLVDVLRSTARGLNIVDPSVLQARSRAADSLILQLSVRQRKILALAATGIDARAIAEQLGIAAVSVRQEMSKVYAILVPDPKPGTDLRTSAVLRYLREMRTYGEESTDL